MSEGSYVLVIIFTISCTVRSFLSCTCSSICIFFNLLFSRRFGYPAASVGSTESVCVDNTGKRDGARNRAKPAGSWPMVSHQWTASGAIHVDWTRQNVPRCRHL